jgi:hypothetical protein
MNDLFAFKPSADAPKFSDFWKSYPRRVAKANAEKAWNKAVKSGTLPQMIMEGLRRQLPYLNSKEMQFIPHPASWLNGGRWEDQVQRIERPTETDHQRHQRESREAVKRELYGESHDQPSDDYDTINLDRGNYRSF